MYTIQNGNVFFQSESEFRHVGLESKIETFRIDDETVEDISYEFDIELGYVERSRITREEPLPQTPINQDDKISALEQQLAQTNQDLAAVLEMILG